MVGTQKYERLRRIAVGGMGEIFLARDVARDVPVILKTLLPQVGEDETAASMFAEEGRLVRQLSHPNIVRVLDVLQDNGEPTIVMEYIQGDTLSGLLRLAKGASLHRPVAFAAMIAQAARGLHAAHAACDAAGRPLGIIHRDISPQNIMVSQDGVVKVVDFGIAKAAGRGTRTKTGVLKGKVAYMAPETVLGLEVDARADLYALGVVLWEVCVGRKAFDGKSDLELLTKVEARVLPPPSTLVPGFSPALEAIVLKALAPDPTKRIQTAAAFADALDAFVQSQPASNRVSLAEYVALVSGAQPAIAKSPQPTAVPADDPPQATAILPPTPVSSKKITRLRVTKLAETAGFRVGHAGPLVMMVFDGKTSLDQMDLLEQALTTVIMHHARYSTLALLSAPIFEKQPKGLNQRAQEIENRFERHIASKAMVVTPTGLAAVMIRSFLAAQSLMARNIPTRVFKSVNEGTAWLQGLPEQVPAIKAMEGLADALIDFAAVPTSAG